MRYQFDARKITQAALPSFLSPSSRTLHSIDLQGVYMPCASLDRMYLRYVRLKDCDAAYLSMRDVDAREVIAIGANLYGACLVGSKFVDCSFRGACLIDAQLGNAVFQNCDLSGAFVGDRIIRCSPSTPRVTGQPLPESAAYLRSLGATILD
jgi:uncharacterized protein YjbI with pentapeptide repeats